LVNKLSEPKLPRGSSFMTETLLVQVKICGFHQKSTFPNDLYLLLDFSP
jgi:hypothetical protein